MPLSPKRPKALTMQEAVDEIDRLHLELATIYQRIARVLSIKNLKAAIKHEAKKKRERERKAGSRAL